MNNQNKLLLLFLSIFAVNVSLFGQGTITFQNAGTEDINSIVLIYETVMDGDSVQLAYELHAGHGFEAGFGAGATRQVGIVLQGTDPVVTMIVFAYGATDWGDSGDVWFVQNGQFLAGNYNVASVVGTDTLDLSAHYVAVPEPSTNSFFLLMAASLLILRPLRMSREAGSSLPASGSSGPWALSLSCYGYAAQWPTKTKRSARVGAAIVGASPKISAPDERD